MLRCKKFTFATDLTLVKANLPKRKH